jgi:hypothetical protein
MTFSDYQTRVNSIVQDGAGKLAAADRDAAITQAIVQRYSKDRPIINVADLPGNGGDGDAEGGEDLPVPAGWELQFSQVMSLEYPVGQNPAEIVEDYDWTMYQAPSGWMIRFLVDSPLTTEVVRVTWTSRHVPDGSTVPAPDFDAVCDFAASLCCERLAAIYAQTGDNSIGADVVNYRTKGSEYLSLAKAARRRYFNHLGLSEDAAESGVSAPALVLGATSNMMGPGVDRLTHRRPR